MSGDYHMIVMYPLARGCQYGAYSPENAGTKYTSPVVSTSLANVSV